MLVLTRRTGQELIIDGQIRLKVLAVKGKYVRLGVEAPSSVRIARSELFARISNESLAPACTNGEAELRGNPDPPR